MIRSNLKVLCLCLLAASPLIVLDGCSHSENPGTSREMSRSESDRTGWFGGQIHEVNTSYRNSDGSTSVETETTTVKGTKTVILRERATTYLDGRVKKDREERTIIKGSDNVERETRN